MSRQSAPRTTVTRTGATIAADLLAGLLCCVTGSAWLALLEPARHVEHGAGPGGFLLQLGAMVGFALVPTVTAVVVLLAATRARGGRTELLLTAPAAALAVAAGAQLHASSAGGDVGPATLLADAATGLVVLLPLLALVQQVRRAAGALSPRRVRAGLALATGAVTLLTTCALTSVAPAASAAPDCLAGGPTDTSFDVTAIDVDIPVNRFGDHDPDGVMYALTDAIPAIRQQEQSQQVSIGLRDDPIQPLVIRANEGDCVAITFTNHASRGAVGMHIDGLKFAVSSSGDQVGGNPSSAADPGDTVTYRFAVPDDRRAEGGHHIHPGPGMRAAVDHGLFGSLVVEPPGSTYWNTSVAGQRLASGWEAIIKPGGVDVPCQMDSPQPTCAFREAAILHHEIGNDNEQLTAKDGTPVPLVDRTTGSYRPGSFAFNYRSESFRNRLLAFPREKSHAYSSYTFGEPSTPMMRGYLADPTKIRLMHAGAEKFHIFHLHGGGDRWRFNPVSDPSYYYADTGLRKDPATALSPSQRLDSQSVGPGESYNLELEGGAGGVQQSAGDFLYHCHIAKHYVSGMWALWRVFDTLQPDLVPLGDRPAPPTAVDSSGLIGRTFGGTKITRNNLDAWIRPQLPPSGIPADNQDATVMDWKVAGTSAAPVYLGAPADPTDFVESPKVVPGQPNLLLVDQGHVVGGRPTILFNPLNGRPAYPLLRTHIGGRPPFTGNGHTGAPYLGGNADAAPAGALGTDPWARRKDGLCPAGRTTRTYNVVAVAKPIRRTPTEVDPDGKVFVLAKDKKALLASPDGGEPLAIRANQGDCVALTLNSEVPDAATFDGFSKVSMHIHHVQFDIQGSDGVSAGFAYEHSVRPYTQVEPTLARNVLKGATSIPLTSVAGLSGVDANGKAATKWIAIGQGTEGIEIRQVRSVNTSTRTVSLTTGLASAHAAGEYAGTEFLQSRWYPDALVDNVFWHDHVDGIHGWGHGLVGQIIVEPKGSTWTDPVTGKPVDSGTLVDIHTTNPLAPGLVDGSFRELALWTINDNDQSAFSTLNLRANPLADRPDKAHQFSSWTYGDPLTPLPRLYPDDPLVVRTISVSPTLDTLHFLGARTLLEPRQSADGQPNGTLIDAIHGGISERFTLVLNGKPDAMRLRAGDYLYANGMEARTQQGAWGIVRVLPGLVPGLQPLPGVTSPTASYTEPTSTGGAPPDAPPGNPCPAGAPARSFDLTAVDRSNVYNGSRTAYVPTVDVNAIIQRTKQPEPLVMHVVAGECVTVTLRNRLLTPVGFGMGKLDREAGSGGVDVGFAPEQDVAPGGTRTYRYYVPTDRIGSAAIGDLANATSLKNGLYGAVVVAPASTVAGQPTIFRDPVTGALKDLGSQVLVRAPGQAHPNYRDFTVTLADDDIAIGRDQMPYPTDADAGRTLLGYRAAPAGDGPGAFAGAGDVPTLTAYAGEPTTVHVLLAPGSENSHVFTLGGLYWPQDRTIRYSNWMSAQGLGAWETFDLDVVGGAGGGEPGDYVYGDARRPFTAVGAWGVQHVLPADSCSVRRVDATTC
ncbi:FtsP/CotA-like multicopper oxidase with cupredoxin domain [Nocardioides aromaticivorans]|uniref:FtsP/CotA-like multicopper oxidase with cupredoxin domain n=1 Tax=Nocardioides aromaticivorans TaxID=200618 RepID=A0A7Z0CPS1_9ACTN|nr:multicopper oxidase domain-containing protein [Nocardioides aromaticivorans]NYI46603.1 FtsP/CotA-like multicopper oxidase with cupredoxin domain [Nocardioides aromaticivorans]